VLAATDASVGCARSILQAAATSTAVPSRSIRLNMVPASVRRWIRRMQPRVTARPLIDVAFHAGWSPPVTVRVRTPEPSAFALQITGYAASQPSRLA